MSGKQKHKREKEKKKRGIWTTTSLLRLYLGERKRKGDTGRHRRPLKIYAHAPVGRKDGRFHNETLSCGEVQYTCKTEKEKGKKKRSALCVCRGVVICDTYTHIHQPHASAAVRQTSTFLFVCLFHAIQMGALHFVNNG